LQKGFRRHQRVPHQASGPESSLLGKSLLLYMRAKNDSFGALLAQKNDEGIMQGIYYLIRTLIEAEF